jgi:Glucodextranase, domain B
MKVPIRLKNLIPLLILLAACSAPPAGMPSGIETGQPTGGVSPSQPPPTLVVPNPVTLTSNPLTLTMPVPTTGTLTSEPLVLTIVSPLDNAVVTEPQINLVGKVSRAAVLTVNNDIHVLPSGDFSIPLTLEEGPNVLEIVASDNDGNEVDLILTVTYQP